MGCIQQLGKSLLIPLGTALLILAASLSFFFMQRNIQGERLAAETRLLGSNFAARLETHLAARLNAGRLLGLRFLHNEVIDVDAFRAETGLLHDLFGDFQALNWVDSDGVIRITTPEEGNSAALGLDLRSLPLPSAALARAEETGGMQITPALTLAQGGIGFAAYVPIRKNSSRGGFLNIVFRAEPLVRNALGEGTERLHVFQVVDGDSLVFDSGNEAAPDAVSHESRIAVGDREWRLLVAPTSARVRLAGSLIDETILAFGVVLAALAGTLSHLVMARQVSLRESQTRFKEFASASSDWFWESDKDHRISWVSDGVEDLLGIPRENYLGRKRSDIREDVGDNTDWEKHAADLNAHRAFRDFVYAIRIQGERKWVRVSGTPRFEPDGKFLGYRGTASDMTELVQSRAQIEGANNRLAYAVEDLDEVFSLWDEEDRLVFGNRVFRELNKDIPELIVPGTSFESYLRGGVDSGHMHDLAGHEDEFMARSLTRRYSTNADSFEIERADGVILRLREQQLEGGGIVTIGQDVTIQRRNEEALRASEERLALAVQKLTIWDWDLETDTLYLSPGFAELLGYSPEELKEIRKLSLTSIIHPDDVDTYRAKITKHLKNPSLTLSNEHRFRTKSGEYKWFLAVGQCVSDVAGRTVRSIGVLTDITERVELEGKLHQAQKMEAIGHLTGGVAHDFNNLLAVILGNLELIKETSDVREIEVLVDQGVIAAMRGADLVKSMLSFAGKSRLEPKAIDLNQLINQTNSWFGRIMPENIEISASLAAEPWTIEVDPALAKSAILNLILNARDAMPNGGKLTIETLNVNLEQDSLEYDSVVDARGKRAVLRVTDTGDGIAEENIANIFQPFFTTKPPGSGSGMGLSMVQGFMKQSGGAVGVESEPGIGTTVELQFQALNREKDTRPKNSHGSASAPSRGAQILLAEDEAAVLKVLEMTLAKAGYQVRSAKSGDEAMSHVDDGLHVDLLITDIVMPGELQGPNLAKQLRRKFPSLPVILLSGHAKDTALGSEFDGPHIIRLTKPVRRATLVDAVESALDQLVEPL